MSSPFRWFDLAWELSRSGSQFYEYLTSTAGSAVVVYVSGP